jgi:hypothetical protein
MKSMGYKIELHHIAENQFYDELDYYGNISYNLQESFRLEIANAFSTISYSPYYQLRYKNYHAFPMKKFPFLIFYIINEDTRLIKICSIFHTNQDTSKYPE